MPGRPKPVFYPGSPATIPFLENRAWPYEPWERMNTSGKRNCLGRYREATAIPTGAQSPVCSFARSVKVTAYTALGGIYVIWDQPW